MADGERLSVRLSSDELALLSELVAEKKYRYESDAVADAVRRLLDENFPPEKRAVVLERARARSELDLNDFISDSEGAEKILGHIIERGLDSDREE